jgi:transcriptional regulator with XRE-family HTH domain
MKKKKNVKVLSSVLEEVGQKLSDLRKKKGYTTLKEFAMDYKLPLIQYWRIEKGKTNFTLRTLLGLLAIHKLSLDKFFC